jgi:hypothetical protein
MFRRGQPVVYNGETYYIVEGPVISTDGPAYQISKVPPPIRVLEHEIKPA